MKKLVFFSAGIFVYNSNIEIHLGEIVNYATCKSIFVVLDTLLIAIKVLLNEFYFLSPTYDCKYRDTRRELLEAADLDYN